MIDCLGRTLDWLYEHDVTRLFAGIARRAREVFDFQQSCLHVDTTSFSVSGQYDGGDDDDDDDDDALICITHGYSRDHRADLKQWMLALGTTCEGDIPYFMRPLDGNSSEKVTLVAAIEALYEQLREEDPEDEDESIFVADSALYTEKNMLRLAQAGVKWISRVPETSTMARSIINPDAPDRQQSSCDGAQLRWYRREVSFPPSEGEEEERLERWVVVSSQASEERARKTLLGKIDKEQQRWEKTLKALSKRGRCGRD